jgi:hypothetical protein
MERVERTLTALEDHIAMQQFAWELQAGVTGLSDEEEGQPGMQYCIQPSSVYLWNV